MGRRKNDEGKKPFSVAEGGSSWVFLNAFLAWVWKSFCVLLLIFLVWWFSGRDGFVELA